MVISALFKKARKGWNMPYLKNPISGVELPSESKWRDRRLNEAEAARFKHHLSTHTHQLFVLIVWFALETAARRGEILRLKRSDVKLRRRMVIFRDTKNGDSRGVPLSKLAVSVLEQVLALHDQEDVFPMSRVTVFRLRRQLRKRADLSDFRFHDLRHEATSRLFERGLSVMEVQKLTGHKALKMLLRCTQLYDNHVVKRLDDTEPVSDLEPGPDLTLPPPRRRPAPRDESASEMEPKLPANVIPFRARR